MTATFAQIGDAEISTIEGVALRRATLEDARAIAKHRRSMFRDIGYHDEAALESMMEKFLPWLKAKIAIWRLHGVAGCQRR